MLPSLLCMGDILWLLHTPVEKQKIQDKSLIFYSVEELRPIASV